MAGAAACFFLSGAAGLAYEVVWARLLGLAFGHTVYAVTTVLAAYMGGLALGSLLLGRWADRVERPLRSYALLEATVGLYCAATPDLLSGVDALYIALCRTGQPSAPAALALQFGLSAAVLLLPTTLMGATLPVLGRAVVEGHELAASRVGTLYAINTWGAVVGTVGTGLLLLPAVGLRLTVWIGVALNLLVAALALLLERGTSPRRTVAKVPQAVVDRAGGAGPLPRAALGLAAAGVSGAAAMAYEVAWTRTLSLVLGSSTYAFTAMLATFLVGLALGALVASRVLRSRRLSLATYGYLQVAVALAALVLLPAFGWLPEAALGLLGRIGVSAGAALAVQFGLSFAVVIVPTLLLGATFPVMVAALARGQDRVGRDIGLVYGANTIGTIVGAVAAGFLLIPAIGLQNTVRAAAGANLCAGVALLVFRAARGRTRIIAAGAVAAYLTLLVALPRWDEKVMTSGVTVYAQDYLRDEGEAFRTAQAGREVLFYSEGISTTVAVERTSEVLSVRVNGKVDASNGPDMPTQVLLGHLGALLHPQPRRALIVGLASGVTVGAVAQHPLEVIDVAELEPAMVHAARFFEKENRRAMADPRVRLVAGDGRHVLAAAAQPYDLVISEPSNPWIAGIASLFTRDFYEIARQRLSDRGVFVQWLQGYGIFTRDMQMVVRTMQGVFPHVSVWTASAGDFVLVATPEALRVDLDSIERRMAASPGLREDLEHYGWSRGDLAFRFFLGEEGARRFAAGAPLNTDDRPLLEFRAPLAVYASSIPENTAAMRASLGAERAPVVGLTARRLVGPEASLRAARSHWRLGWQDEALVAIARAGPAAGLDPTLRFERGRLLALLGSFDEAAEDLAAVERQRPDDVLVRSYQRAALDLQRRPPRGAELRAVLFERCGERRELGYCHLAAELLEGDLRIAPDALALLTNNAGVRYQLGDLPGAEASLRRALAVHAGVASTHFNLALVLQEQGRLSDAAVELEEALRLDPGQSAARRRLEGLRAKGTR